MNRDQFQWTSESVSPNVKALLTQRTTGASAKAAGKRQIRRKLSPVPARLITRGPAQPPIRAVAEVTGSASAPAAPGGFEQETTDLQRENAALRRELDAKEELWKRRLLDREMTHAACLRERENQWQAMTIREAAGRTRLATNRLVRDLVRTTLPEGARVLVISKGDDDLIRLDGRCGMHFPQVAGGVYAGHHPGDSGEAIAHLESLKAEGAEYLLIPATAFWWLDFYTDFRRHLETHYRLIEYREGTYLIYALADARSGQRAEFVFTLRPLADELGPAAPYEDSAAPPAQHGTDPQVAGLGTAAPVPSVRAAMSQATVVSSANVDAAQKAPLPEGLGHPPPTTPESTEALRRIARASTRQKAWSEARDSWAMLISAGPDDFEARFRCAQASLALGQYGAAAEHAAHAARLQPGHVHNVSVLASSLQRSGRTVSACQALADFLVAAPDRASAIGRLGMALQKQLQSELDRLDAEMGQTAKELEALSGLRDGDTHRGVASELETAGEVSSRLEILLARRRERSLQLAYARRVLTPLLKPRPRAAAASDGWSPQRLQSTNLSTTPTPSERLRMLRVACIMDEFSFASFQPEAVFLRLSPTHWRAELESFSPELLLVESAWRGKDGLWGNKVGHRSGEVQDLLQWCGERAIPTAFWNKEDPVHFETFLTTAKLFDFVFTTDLECIPRYKAALGHERIFLLPFACQPASTHPMETYERKDAFCFAGAYYARYPERTRDLSQFILTLPGYRPVEIYDRNHGKLDPHYEFPMEYQPFIVGNLPFDQIDRAYKGYRYAINLNSIKQSQTMFARRVFELLASNTLTVSNFSRGLRLLLGDLVVTSDEGGEIVRRLNELQSDDTQLKKLQLLGLRKVLREHTYQDRFAYLVSKTLGQDCARLLPRVTVIALARDQNELNALLSQYAHQTYPHKHGVLVIAHRRLKAILPSGCDIRVIEAAALGRTALEGLVPDAEFVATLVPEDYYGPSYLWDLALATRFSQADALGKAAHYEWSPTHGLTVASAEQEYRTVSQLPVRAALLRANLVDSLALLDWLSNASSRAVTGGNLIAIDRFNYCRFGQAPGCRSASIALVNDLDGVNTGIDMDVLIRRAERCEGEASTLHAGRVLTGAEFRTHFGHPTDRRLSFSVNGTGWHVQSALPEGMHAYVYAAHDFGPSDLGYASHAKFCLEATPGLNVQMVMLFLDAAKNRIDHLIKPANRNQEAEIPAGTAYLRLGLRIYSAGSATIRGLVLGHRLPQQVELVPRARHLLVTNEYPSYDSLYRNAFVHSRVSAYRKRGVLVDVFRFRADGSTSFHEFHNTDVVTGPPESLSTLLKGGHYESVLVHCLNEKMWQSLQPHVERTPICVWVHGAEIQPWQRRAFNFDSEEQQARAKAESDARLTFWRGLIARMPTRLTLVFVSRYFAEEVMEDLGLRIPRRQYRIIHNPIDTELFEWIPKAAEQRRKILSIRPYASRKYANDLTVQAILSLSRAPFFQELEFRLIGDGRLFDETLAPLRTFENVNIEKRFVPPGEIAALHREYGVFLSPTRMDSQGVSRDEAMASGLVPVTNRVAAVPEFVDDRCGILAEPEDAAGLAEGIARLYQHPRQFLKMSEAAAARVRRQSSPSQTVTLELQLMEALARPPATARTACSPRTRRARMPMEAEPGTTRAVSVRDREALVGRDPETC